MANNFKSIFVHIVHFCSSALIEPEEMHHASKLLISSLINWYLIICIFWSKDFISNHHNLCTFKLNRKAEWICISNTLWNWLYTVYTANRYCCQLMMTRKISTLSYILKINMLRTFPPIWLSLGAICIIFLRKQLSSAVNAQLKKIPNTHSEYF